MKTALYLKYLMMTSNEVKMFEFECLSDCFEGNTTMQCDPDDWSDCCSPEGECHPDYGLDCSPEGECGPNDGSEDPY